MIIAIMLVLITGVVLGVLVGVLLMSVLMAGRDEPPSEINDNAPNSGENNSSE